MEHCRQINYGPEFQVNNCEDILISLRGMWRSSTAWLHICQNKLMCASRNSGVRQCSDIRQPAQDQEHAFSAEYNTYTILAAIIKMFIFSVLVKATQWDSYLMVRSSRGDEYGLRLLASTMLWEHTHMVFFASTKIHALWYVCDYAKRTKRERSSICRKYISTKAEEE